MAEEEENHDWSTSNEAKQIDKEIESLKTRRSELVAGAAAGKRISRSQFAKLGPNEQMEFTRGGGAIYD